MDVLNIEVGTALARRWIDWLAPARQPFFLTGHDARTLDLTCHRGPRTLSPELRDTYEIWNLPDHVEPIWLDEREFHDYPRQVRATLVQEQVRIGRAAVPAVREWSDTLDPRTLRAQADGHRFVWWPSLVRLHRNAVLQRVVGDGQLPCQRTSITEETWGAAAEMLPHARGLAGTFARGSRGSPSASGAATFCFATVMAAAGVKNPDEAPFEDWLAANCASGGSDGQPGTVLVWRDRNRSSTHAAVTLGAGWALHKPSQEWRSPRQILAVADLIRLAPPAVTLHRYSLLHNADV